MYFATFCWTLIHWWTTSSSSSSLPSFYTWIYMDEYFLRLLTWQCWVLTVSWNLSLTLLMPVNLNTLPILVTTSNVLFFAAYLHANFIQHKWLVDHSTSIATKAELLVRNISSSGSGTFYCATFILGHTYFRAHKRR